MNEVSGVSEWSTIFDWYSIWCKIYLSKFVHDVKEKGNNNFWNHRWRYMCLVIVVYSVIVVWRLMLTGVLSALKNFAFSGKTFDWVPSFPARIFISLTSVKPIFKNFPLQLFFREILNGKSIKKKTLTITLPNNFRSIYPEVFSGGFTGEGWQGVTNKPSEGASIKNLATFSGFWPLKGVGVNPLKTCHWPFQ